MTTSDEKRGVSRAMTVALVIVAMALALLPALRGSGATLDSDPFAADCATSATEDCRD